MKKWIVPTILGFGLVFVACFILFGFSINWPGELESARAKWEAQGIEDYRYRVGFGSYSSIGSIYITVKNGHVTGIEYDVACPLCLPHQDVGSQIDILPGWYATSFSRIFPPDLSYYSIDQLFYFVEQNQKQPPPQFIEFEGGGDWRFLVSFDEDLGYVKSLKYSSCPEPDFGLAFFSSRLPHCSFGFGITDFEVLDE